MFIIKSLLDTDLYKITMMQAVYDLFPNVKVRYKFKCRNEGIDFKPFIDKINSEIDYLCSLSFTTDELNYLAKMESRHGTRIFKPMFLNFLKDFNLPRNSIIASIDEDGELSIKTKGTWLSTILFEVPVLAIVNECYFSQFKKEDAFIEGRKRVDEKVKFLKLNPGFSFAEFGTRRRFSSEWHSEALELFVAKAGESLAGTSNVLMAKEFGLTPIGTMAHEWLQAGQGLTNLRDSVMYMIEAWTKVYRGDLGIALTDVISSRIFFEDFDLMHSKLFDGVRHDSGDPYKYGRMVIDHYRKFSIDAWTKTIVFSDGLDIRKGIDLWRTFTMPKIIKSSYGIGTNITNDLGIPALNIVMKMVECNGQPVAKISDTPGKGMCEDDHYIEYLKVVFGI